MVLRVPLSEATSTKVTPLGVSEGGGSCLLACHLAANYLITLI